MSEGQSCWQNNLPVMQWAMAFTDDQTLTATMLERLLHHAHFVQISGENNRARHETIT